MVQMRNYIKTGNIDSLTHFFSVLKAKGTDIWMVYNGTSSRLNGALWAPHFFLPTMSTQLRALKEGTYMGDMDIGEMFLNFMLHESLRAVCGVDVTFVRSTDPKFKEWEEGCQSNWERWCRTMMGLAPSPFFCIQQTLWGKELIMGDRHCQSNPFRWDWIQLNLPTMEGYDPQLPWVAKIRGDGSLASDIFLYVDDV